MNTSQSTPITTWPPQTQGGGGQFVGAALLTIPELATPFAAMIFGGAIRAALARDGIQQTEICAMLAGSAFIAYVGVVQNARAALRPIHSAIRAMGMLELAEIGFFDEGEAFWRTVLPSGRGQFDRFLTPEVFALNRDKCAALEARIQALRSVLQQAKDEPDVC